jgi:hypothetical protein
MKVSSAQIQPQFTFHRSAALTDCQFGQDRRLTPSHGGEKQKKHEQAYGDSQENWG